MALSLSFAFASCVGTPTATSAPCDRGFAVALLAPVTSWAIQLQGLEHTDIARTLTAASVDMLVLEPMRSQRGQEAFEMRELVRRVQASRGSSLPSKRCIAYLNVGQAEDYRTYWQGNWRAPTANGAGEPSFLVGLDPDGWQGNYPVAYWRPEWKRCLFGHPDAPLDQAIADGFDGIYTDWVLGCFDANVRAAAAADGVDAFDEMVRLLGELRAYARARAPLFTVVAQNALALAEQRPAALGVIDALAQEDVSFKGLASAGWNDANAGDIPAVPAGETAGGSIGERLQRVRAQAPQLPVFTLDYALQPANIARAITASRAHGFVPCVSRTPLDRLPQ